MAPTQIEEQVRALVEGIVTGAGAELDAVTILKQNGALVCRITVEEPLGSEKAILGCARGYLTRNLQNNGCR